MSQLASWRVPDAPAWTLTVSERGVSLSAAGDASSAVTPPALTAADDETPDPSPFAASCEGVRVELDGFHTCRLTLVVLCAAMSPGGARAVDHAAAPTTAPPTTAEAIASLAAATAMAIAPSTTHVRVRLAVREMLPA
jgi:hypothetical protein